MNGDAFASDAERNYAVPATNPFVGIAGADEVFAYGLRNPFRNSFDRATGDLYIADMGQGLREEVDVITAGSAGGQNFGWNVREGEIGYPDPSSPDNPAFTDPIAVYDHARPNGGFSITGGYVNRGPGGLAGAYLFADFVTNNLWSLKVEDGRVLDYTLRTPQITVAGGSFNQIASFAEDGQGRLYTVGLDGEIHRLDFSASASDGGDILEGRDGNDRLFGGAGDDYLAGGVGADRLDGGVGVNVLVGGEGFDLAVYTGAGVYLDLAVGAYSGPGRYDVFSGIEGVVGTEAADTLFADGGANRLEGQGGDDILIGRSGNDDVFGGSGDDYLDGGDGADRLAGGLGVNVLRGGAGLDIAEYSDRAEGVWVDLSVGVYSGPGAFESFDSIEGVLGSRAADALFGDEQDNSLSGDGGNDALQGRGGADFLSGGLGDDTLLGGAGDDRLLGAEGVDVMTGGEGRDVFDLFGGGWDVAYDFDVSSDRVTLGGGRRFESLLMIDADGDGAIDDSKLMHVGETFVALNVSTLSLDDWNGLVL